MRQPITYKAFSKPDLNVPVTVLILSGLMLVAAWIRFSGLGARPLAEDEYFFIKSVHNILEHGVPRFSTGGYYTRGLPLQYLTAISISLFGDGGFAYRLPSALFGVGTLVMAYFLGRQFLNRSWSVLLVAILTFSAWEIEFSRFARMYPAFQFFTVCFFWSFYRYSFQCKSNKRYLPVAFAIVATLTHALGIFIALLLFLPFPAWLNRDFRTTLWEQRIYIAISSMVLLIGLFQVKYSFGLIGVSDPLPPDFISPLAQNPHWLSFGSGLFGNIGFLSIAALAIACLVGLYVLYVVRNCSITSVEEYFIGGLVVVAVSFAVIHQFAMCAVIILVVVLREPKLLLKKPYTYFFGLLAGIAFFWFTLFFFNQAWIETVGLGNIVRSYLRSVRLAFFAFPDLYTPAFCAWAEFMPMLGLFLGIAMTYHIVRIRKLPLISIVRQPVIPIIIIVILMGFEPPLYVRTRYTYFLYPLVLCVGLLSAVQLGRIITRRFNVSEHISKIAAIALSLVAFTVSEDFHPFQISHVNSDTISFRMGRYERFQQHWYNRFDYLKPAEFVNSASAPDSRVIVSYKVNTVNAYLKPEHAVYWTWEDIRFAGISREGGTRELWSGSRLLSTVEGVIKYTQKADIVWLVVLGVEDPLKRDFEKAWPSRMRDAEVFTPGRDKRIEVWRIELK